MRLRLSLGTEGQGLRGLGNHILIVAVKDRDEAPGDIEPQSSELGTAQLVRGKASLRERDLGGPDRGAALLPLSKTIEFS